MINLLLLAQLNGAYALPVLGHSGAATDLPKRIAALCGGGGESSGTLLNREGRVDRSTLPLNLAEAGDRLPGYDWGQVCLHDYLDRMEENILREALEKSGGSKREAAVLLRIPLPTLKSKLIKFHLTRADETEPGDAHDCDAKAPPAGRGDEQP